MSVTLSLDPAEVTLIRVGLMKVWKRERAAARDE